MKNTFLRNLQNISLLIVLSFIILLYSCEKEITVDLPQHEPKIVIESAIEQGQYAWAFITRTAAYFAKVDSTVIMNMIVTSATVVVSDGFIKDTLQLTLDPYTFPYLKYVGKKIIGQAGKQYWLTVTVDGNTYTAVTTIPNPTSFDSIVFKPDKNQDTLGFIWIYLRDPDTL